MEAMTDQGAEKVGIDRALAIIMLCVFMVGLCLGFVLGINVGSVLS